VKSAARDHVNCLEDGGISFSAHTLFAMALGTYALHTIPPSYSSTNSSTSSPGVSESTSLISVGLGGGGATVWGFGPGENLPGGAHSHDPGV